MNVILVTNEEEYSSAILDSTKLNKSIKLMQKFFISSEWNIYTNESVTDFLLQTTTVSFYHRNALII